MKKYTTTFVYRIYVWDIKSGYFEFIRFWTSPVITLWMADGMKETSNVMEG